MIFHGEREIACKILENFCLVIHLVKFRQYSGQDCIFVGSDIRNHQLRIRMESNQRKLIIMLEVIKT